MRFAYIDSNGNEVPIPSVDALALRIELGAITEGTQLYDAQADQWGPAHTHEIFHTLSRHAGEGEGFVAPPPVAPPPVTPSTDEADEPRGAETPAEPEAVEEQADETEETDTSFGLTLAEPAPPSDDEAGTEPRGPRRADELPLREPKVSDAEADDDLPYLDLGPEEPDEEEVASGAAGPGGTAEPSAAGFDFGGMSGELALEGSEEPPMDLASEAAGSGSDLGDAMELETGMEFDAGGFDAGAAGPMDLERPMSEFAPGEPPSWMEEGAAQGSDKVLDFSSTGAEAEGEIEVPLRDRRTPRNKPSPPKLRRQYNLALPIIGVVVVLAVGIGGYVAWPIVRDRLLGPGEGESLEVYIPPLAEELEPQMRESAEAALGAVFERESAEWAQASRVQEPPSVWLAGMYLANAGDYARVEEFWDGMADFLDRVRGIDLGTFDTALSAELQARGIAEPDREAIRARADSGFVAAAPERAQIIEDFEGLIDAALQLHRFLVANESAIEYAPATAVTTDPVLEVNPATEEIREAMEELLDAVTRSLRSLDYRDPVTARGLRELLRTRIQQEGVR